MQQRDHACAAKRINPDSDNENKNANTAPVSCEQQFRADFLIIMQVDGLAEIYSRIVVHPQKNRN